ncbi:hypothetical protein [Jiangella ureilytica]|nr:hypothetical protein [Jiangella ureilytica]
MHDLAYIGLTVIFFIAMALLAAGADRLGRRYGTEAGPTHPEARP